MEHKHIYTSKITPLSPAGFEGISYMAFVNWLILRGCFSASGGVPVIKAVTNI